MEATDHTTGRHTKLPPVQVNPQDGTAQAMDAALREARNWAALRSASAYRCPMKETARLAVTCPVAAPTGPTPVGRRFHLSFPRLFQSLLK